MRRRDGLLHVELPVDDADDALRDEADDARAARRADEQTQAPALVEQHRRRHARQRPLAAFDAIRDGLAADGRHVVEVRELVVQDEAADHELAAERALHARRHRDGVAEAVDDREVARRRPFGRGARREVPSRGRQRLAGRDRRHGLVGIDQRGARAQVAGVEQAGDGRRDELRIAEIEIAVGEREAVGLGEQVDRLHGLRANVGQLEVREHAEHLLRRHAARRRQLRAADAPRAIRRAERRRDVGSVRARDPAASFGRGARCCRAPRRRSRPRARPCACGSAPPAASSSQRRRVLGVLQPIADGVRLAARVVEVAAEVVAAREALEAVQ